MQANYYTPQIKIIIFFLLNHFLYVNETFYQKTHKHNNVTTAAREKPATKHLLVT